MKLLMFSEHLSSCLHCCLTVKNGRYNLTDKEVLALEKVDEALLLLRKIFFCKEDNSDSHPLLGEWKHTNLLLYILHLPENPYLAKQGKILFFLVRFARMKSFFFLNFAQKKAGTGFLGSHFF